MKTQVKHTWEEGANAYYKGKSLSDNPYAKGTSDFESWEAAFIDAMPDLFEDYDDLPNDVKAVCDKYITCDTTYENCALLVQELNAIGYTCAYGLDAEPFKLRKL